jgi:hypothetical protein
VDVLLYYDPGSRYYFIGIGGYCGMPQPIEQADNNFIALRTTGAGGRAPMLYTEFQNGTNGQVGEWASSRSS